MTTALFVFAQDNISLADALAAYAGLIGSAPAPALLYSPRSCQMALFRNGNLQGPDGQSMAPGGDIFEARLFCEVAELRWLDDPASGRGCRAAILTEQDVSASLSGWGVQKQDVIETLKQKYLLWGRATELQEHQGRPLAEGWIILATAQIGTLPVPLSLPTPSQGQQVLLHTVEYVVESEHGNAIIGDERLVQLEVARG